MKSTVIPIRRTAAHKVNREAREGSLGWAGMTTRGGGNAKELSRSDASEQFLPIALSHPNVHYSTDTVIPAKAGIYFDKTLEIIVAR